MTLHQLCLILAYIDNAVNKPPVETRGSYQRRTTRADSLRQRLFATVKQGDSNDQPIAS
jgi:hypothetical protein